MRSRAEGFATGVAIAALAVLFVAAFRGVQLRPVYNVPAAFLPKELPRWTVAARAETLNVSVVAPVAPAEREWLQALKGAGTTVTWSGAIPTAALEAEPGRVWIAAPDGVVQVGDALGALDSLDLDAPGGALLVEGTRGAIVVHGPQFSLRRDPGREAERSVVVFGDAGWEPRYAVAALEARGHRVEARFRIGPGNVITQGGPLPLDTARHSVAIVVGNVESRVMRSVRQFVAQGGGLVVAGAGRGLDDLLPGRLAAPVRPVSGLSVPASRRDLEYRPIVRLAAGSGILDGAGGGARVASRRVGAGRVVLIGDRETWRLALGSSSGEAEHGRLWDRAVVAARPSSPAQPSAGDETAPRAAMFAALGAPRSAPDSPARAAIPWEALAGVALLTALIAEWAARRIRGLP